MKKSVIKSILSEPDSDEYSYKRVIGVTGAFALIIDMLMCSFFRWAIAPPQFLAEIVSYIIIVCLFGSVGEKVAQMIANKGQKIVKSEITSTVTATASEATSEKKENEH